MTSRVRSAAWVMLVLLPIAVTLLGVALAGAGGWLGIGLVIALQLSVLAALVRAADHPPTRQPGPPTASAKTPPVDGSSPANAPQPSEGSQT